MAVAAKGVAHKDVEEVEPWLVEVFPAETVFSNHDDL